MLNSKKTRGAPTKESFFRVFLSSQAVPFSVFSLGLARYSFCIGNGENSEKSNHMLTATSHIELDFLTISEHVKDAKSAVPEGAVTYCDQEIVRPLC